MNKSIAILSIILTAATLAFANPCGDLNADGNVDNTDFELLISHWFQTGCGEPDYCGGADLNKDGVVDVNDVVEFIDNCLKDEGDFDKLYFSDYYVPYDNPIEPNAPGYKLPLDLAAVVNYTAVSSALDLKSTAQLLEQNGFAVIEHDFGWFDPNRDDIVKPYEYLRDRDVPLFVTADTLLHLYHIQFDETLKDIEEREFIADIDNLTTALLDDAMVLYEQYTGRLKEAAKRNVAYLAVAKKLIDPNNEVPQLVADLVAGELAKIDAHEGFANSDIFIYEEDYSQYVPRGHYTRSEQLKRYFKTLMWYGRMAFLLKGAENWGPIGEALISVEDAKIQTIQAVLLARSIEAVNVDARTGREVWDRMYAVTAFYVGLADDLTPYEYLGAVDKVFGGTFEPSILENELIEQGDTEYIDYWLHFNELKDEFDALDTSEWNRNLYWSWLYSLRALIEGFAEGYPNFMRTQAWQEKELNAALASWTQLRHDTILYAKQSYTPVRVSLPPQVSGYLEPVPEFYGRLLALTQMTRQGLSDLDALSTTATTRLENFETILNRMIEIANKELTNQPLSEDDYEYIRRFAKTLEGAVIEVEDAALKTTLAADVHTHIVEEKVVEEGTGYVDLIIVACPSPDGSIFLAAGPVLSYYEFKHPMSDRLTDEAWRELLDSPDRPDRPKWFEPLVR